MYLFLLQKKIFTSISTYPQESLKIHFESEINQIFRFLLGVVKDLSVLCKKKKIKKIMLYTGTWGRYPFVLRPRHIFLLFIYI